MSPSFLHSIGVPDSSPGRRYGLVAIVDSIGTGLVLPSSVLYFTRVVGLSASSVGLGMAIAGVAGLLANPFSGALIQRFGARAVAVTCFAASIAAYAGFVLVDSWLSFVVLASLAQASERAARPAKQTIMAAIAEGPERVKLLAFNRAIRNGGFAIGALVATAALANGTRPAFAALMFGNAASYAAAIALLLKIKLPGELHRATRRAAHGYKVVLRNRRFVALTALSAVILLQASIVTVGLPVWVTNSTTVPVSIMGVIFALNTVLIMGLQVRATAGVTEVAHATQLFQRAAIALAVTCALFASAGYLATGPAVAVLLAGALALTIGEIWTSVAEFVVSMGLSDEATRGPHLAFYGLGQDVQQLIGPLVVASALEGFGGFGWILLALLMSGACVASAAFVANVQPEARPVAAPVEST